MFSERGHPMRYTLSNEKHDLKHDFPPTLIKEKTRDTSSTGELPIGEIQSEHNSLGVELLGGTALVPSLAKRLRRPTGDSSIRRSPKRRQQEADNPTDKAALDDYMNLTDQHSLSMKALPKVHVCPSEPVSIEREMDLNEGLPRIQDSGRGLEHPETTHPRPDIDQSENPNANRETTLRSVSNQSRPPKSTGGSRANMCEERGRADSQRLRTDEETGDYINTVRAMQEEDIHESDIRIIQDTKFIGHQAYYLVLWCDTSRGRSWEPYSRLQACSRSVARYHKQDPFALPP